MHLSNGENNFAVATYLIVTDKFLDTFDFISFKRCVIGRYGDCTRQVEQSEVEAAAKIANIHDFVESLPEVTRTKHSFPGYVATPHLNFFSVSAPHVAVAFYHNYLQLNSTSSRITQLFNILRDIQRE